MERHGAIGRVVAAARQAEKRISSFRCVVVGITSVRRWGDRSSCRQDAGQSEREEKQGTPQDRMIDRLF